MANALRPAVLLIVVASLLFFAAGYLDTAAGTTDPSTLASWAFGAVNLLVAVFIARGSERVLALRIGLAAFFMVERPVSAVAFGPKPLEAVALHMATAVLEGVILLSTLRIWRLGQSVDREDLAFLQLPATPLVATAGAAAPALDAPVVGPIPGVVVPRGRKDRREKPERRPRTPLAEDPLAAGKPTWASRLIAVLALLLAVTLVAEPASRGIVPGASVDLSSTRWLGYLFALVVLALAARAVHQGRFAVRLLLVAALIILLERAFAPFASGGADPATYGVHLAAALFALGLALACAASLRATRPQSSALPL